MCRKQQQQLVCVMTEIYGTDLALSPPPSGVGRGGGHFVKTYDTHIVMMHSQILTLIKWEHKSPRNIRLMGA